MAIMHFRISHVSRSTGRSSVQSAAYITGEKLTDSRTNQPAIYKRSADGIYSWDVMAPENAPPEFKTLEGWNKLEAFEDEWAGKYFKKPETLENHKNNARISMNVIAALPRELSLDQSKDLVCEFIQKSFVDKGHYVTYAIHDEEGNPHVHMMVSHRYIDETGAISNKKNRSLCSISAIKSHRHRWAEITNKHLEMHGVEQRVTASSYVDLGIDLIPTVHEGWYPQSLLKQGEFSFVADGNQKIREENQNKILANPMIVLDYMTKTNATFTMPQLLAKIESYFPGNEKAVSYVYQAISDNLVLLGEDVSAETRFTSKEYRDIENKAVESFNSIKENSWGNVIPELDVMKHIYAINEQLVQESGNPDAQLNEEQRQAIEGICQNHQVSVLVGRAGAGKTTSLRAIKNIFEEQGCQVMGAALSASAAKNLADDTGCFSETVRFYINRWNKLETARSIISATGDEAKQYTSQEVKNAHTTVFFNEKYDLTDKSIFLVDEASMIGTRDWGEVLSRVQSAGAKLVVVGDGRQFSAIEAGDIHRYMEDNIRSESRFILADINRQKVGFMKGASIEFSNQNVHEALAIYEHADLLTCVPKQETPEKSYELLYTQVAQDYIARIQRVDSGTGVVLAYTNDSCNQINKIIRQELKEIGKVSQEDFPVSGVSLATGDEIVFLKNHRLNEGVAFYDVSGNTPVDVTMKHFIRNGTTGVVEHINPIEQEVNGEKLLSYQLDVRLSDNLKATVNTLYLESGSIAHAYALTTHKSQGRTLDWTLVVGSKNMDSSATYVALTRHRFDTRLYYSEQDFSSFANLQHSLGKASYKDMAQDYRIQSQNQIYFNNVEKYRLITMEMAEMISTENIYEGEAKDRMEFLEKERTSCGRNILDNFDKHALYASQAKLTRMQIEITCGVTKRPLSRAEKIAKERVIAYVNLATNCRWQWETLKKTGRGEALYNNPAYMAYEQSKQSRDLLALEIHMNKPLHRPFMRTVGDAMGYGFNVIERQAKHALYREDFAQNLPFLKVQASTYQHFKVDMTVPEFWKTEEFHMKGKAAMEITANYLHEKTQNLPKMTLMYLKEQKVDGLKVRQDAFEYNKFVFAKNLQDPSEQRHAELVAAYGMVNRQAQDIYRGCVEKIKVYNSKVRIEEKKLAIHQAKDYPKYIEVTGIANKITSELSSYDKETTQALANLFGITIDKLDGHNHMAASERNTPQKTVPEQKERFRTNIPHVLDHQIDRLDKAQAEYQKALKTKAATINFESFRNQQVSIKDIENELKDRIVPLALDLFAGEKLHTKSQKHLKFGRKGSKSIIVSGSKQGVYADFETGVKGNVFTMIQDRLGVSFKEALDWSQEWLGNPTRQHQWETFKATQKDHYKAIEDARFVSLYPAPKDPVNIIGNKYLNYALGDGKETMRFAYHDADKNLLGYVVRIEQEDGSKVTLPLTYCKDLKTNNSYWKWRGFGKDAPLYGLDKLAEKPKAPVLVVEGEKAADAAREQFKDYAVVTWPGGASAVTQANWDVLKGRDVIIWPDNDKAGLKAADKIKEVCTKIKVHSVGIVQLPESLPKKWDLADACPEGIKQEDIRNLADKTLQNSMEQAQHRDKVTPQINALFKYNELAMTSPEFQNQVKAQTTERHHGLLKLCQSIGVELTDADKAILLKTCFYIEAKAQEIRLESQYIDRSAIQAQVQADRQAVLQSLYLKKDIEVTLEEKFMSSSIYEKFDTGFDKAVAQVKALSGKKNPEISPSCRHGLAVDVVKIINICPKLEEHLNKVVEHQLAHVERHLPEIDRAISKIAEASPKTERQVTTDLVIQKMYQNDRPNQAEQRINQAMTTDRQLQVQQDRIQQLNRQNSLSI